MKIKIFIAVLCLFFYGCHSSSPSKSATILRVNFSEDPATLDPRKGGDPISTTCKFMLFEGLTRMTPFSNSELALAKEIAISEDKKVYTFHLRDALWSNGDPITAHDFVYAWKTQLEPNFPAPDSLLLFPIKNARAAKLGELSNQAIGVKAINDKTLEVTLEHPISYFLDLISFCIYFPVPHKRGFSQEITNGPFMIQQYQPNNCMILEKNPLYWNAQHIDLDGVQISFIKDETTTLNLYMQQKIDVLGSRFSSIPLDALSQIKKHKDFQSMPLGATSFCTFNVNTFPFSNVHIRKAFAYAMDREGIVNHITQLNEEVAFDPIPPLLKKNCVHGFFPKQDIEQAQEHLKLGLEELGIEKKDLQNISLVYLIGDTHTKVVQALQHQWMNVLGIRVKLEGYTNKVYLDKLMQRDYQLGYALWIIQYPDAMNIFDRFKFKSNAKNYPGWENVRYIDLLDQSIIASPSNRMHSLLEAEKLLIDEMPIAPIYHWKEALLQQPYVSGVYISPIGSVHLNSAKINKGKIYEN